LLPKRVFEMRNHLQIAFSGPSGFSELRRDALQMHAWIAQVYGEKEVVLYEPGQEHLLYVDPQQTWRSTVCDRDDMENYPLLRQARRHRIVLRPGDALFVPCGTWLVQRSPRVSISVTFDQLERSNWNAFVAAVVAAQRRYGNPLRALAADTSLRLLGPVLDAAEWLGGNCAGDWGCDGRTGWKAARRCPAQRL
jgi:hypothetical protein